MINWVGEVGGLGVQSENVPTQVVLITDRQVGCC